MCNKSFYYHIHPFFFFFCTTVSKPFRNRPQSSKKCNTQLSSIIIASVQSCRVVVVPRDQASHTRNEIGRPKTALSREREATKPPPGLGVICARCTHVVGGQWPERGRQNLPARLAVALRMDFLCMKIDQAVSSVTPCLNVPPLGIGDGFIIYSSAEMYWKRLMFFCIR